MTVTFLVSLEILLILTNDNFLGRKCGEDEYRCNNDRCIPKIAYNDCNGTDWCGDGSGCGDLSSSDAVLIGSICAVVCCAILGILVGICLARYIKAKRTRVR